MRAFGCGWDVHMKMEVRAFSCTRRNLCGRTFPYSCAKVRIWVHFKLVRHLDMVRGNPLCTISCGQEGALVHSLISVRARTRCAGWWKVVRAYYFLVHLLVRAWPPSRASAGFQSRAGMSQEVRDCGNVQGLFGGPPTKVHQDPLGGRPLDQGGPNHGARGGKVQGPPPHSCRRH